MPNYPYRCTNCHKKFEVYLTYNEYGTHPVVCPHCGDPNVERRISRIRISQSDESRLDSLSDFDNLDGLEDDPRALGKMMRKMSQEMGEDVQPEINEMVDRLEAGQSPEEIEAAIPDLGGEDNSNPGFDDF
jgi:putative FmdB family regulatory protein